MALKDHVSRCCAHVSSKEMDRLGLLIVEFRERYAEVERRWKELDVTVECVESVYDNFSWKEFFLAGRLGSKRRTGRLPLGVVGSGSGDWQGGRSFDGKMRGCGSVNTGGVA